MDVAPSAETTATTATVADEPRVAEPSATAAPAAGGTLLEDELLVEEVSIDGMCGVY